MMKRVKKAAMLLTAMLAAVLLSACHGRKQLPAFEIPDGLEAGKQYEITFWAKNDTNVTQTRIYQKAISDFQKLYPNITVNLRLYTDYGRIYNDVITNIPTQTTPNVCITYPDHVATYLQGSHVVVPLDEIAKDPRYGFGGTELKFDSPSYEEIVPEFLKEGVLNGTQYAIPYMRSTEACYINKTYVEKLGYTLPEKLTWDFVWEVSDKAAEKGADGIYPVNGQKVMIPFIYKSTDNMMIQMLKQKDAGYSEEDGTIGIFNDTTKELLYTVAEHVKSGAFSTFKISSYPANFLNAGQCIFAIDSTAGATWMGTEAPNLDISADNVVEFETVVMEIPQFDPEAPKMISQGPSICVFNKADSGEVLASWLFAQYLLTNDVQIAYAETEGYVPVTKKAQSDPAYQEYLSLSGTDNDTHYSVKIDAAKLLMAHTSDTFTTPVFSGSASLRDAAGQMIENVAKSVRRNEKVDDAYMEKLFDSVTSLYRLDQLGSQNRNSGESQDLGPLPSTSAALIAALIVVWLLIGAYWLTKLIRRKKAGE